MSATVGPKRPVASSPTLCNHHLETLIQEVMWAQHELPTQAASSGRPEKDRDPLRGGSCLSVRKLTWTFSLKVVGDAEMPTRPIVSSKKAMLKPYIRLKSFTPDLPGVTGDPLISCPWMTGPRFQAGGWSCRVRAARQLWTLLLKKLRKIIPLNFHLAW